MLANMYSLLSHPSNANLSNTNTPDMNLDNNPAYETQTPLQRNLAYEDTTLQSQSADEPQSSSTQDPTYEIIPPAASGNTITAHTDTKKQRRRQ